MLRDVYEAGITARPSRLIVPLNPEDDDYDYDNDDDDDELRRERERERGLYTRKGNPSKSCGSVKRGSP